MLTSTIFDEHPFYGPSPPIITFSENLRSSPSAVIMSLPKIISYILLVDLSTWHFHITILVALKSGKKKSTFTFFEVVNFPAWVSHVFVFAFYLSFDFSLPITIVELFLMSNRIRKFLNLLFRYRCSYSHLGLVSKDYV